MGYLWNYHLYVIYLAVAQCEEFKQKYIEEQKKRKKLFNEVQEAKGMFIVQSLKLMHF